MKYLRVMIKQQHLIDQDDVRMSIKEAVKERLIKK